VVNVTNQKNTTTMSEIEQRAIAAQACPQCGAEAGAPCTRITAKGTVELKHLHADRMAAHGKVVGQAATARRAAAGSGKPDEPAKFTRCKRCGYQYSAPWGQDHCGSEKFCDRRRDINAAERKLHLPVTAWKSPGLMAQMRDAAAKVDAARKAAAA
jgi:hypothetical protein